MIRKECGRLLEQINESWAQADHMGKSDGQSLKDLKDMICVYQKTLKHLEQIYGKQDDSAYLIIRRARFAVDCRMVQHIAPDVLYRWMVQNVCDIEGSGNF